LKGSGKIAATTMKNGKKKEKCKAKAIFG